MGTMIASSNLCIDIYFSEITVTALQDLPGDLLLDEGIKDDWVDRREYILRETSDQLEKWSRRKNHEDTSTLLAIILVKQPPRGNLEGGKKSR